MTLFQNLTFARSVHFAHNLPPAEGLEIAFAGRSNAGKSSAINALANHNRLAFVSKTPGRTQLINFFRMANGNYLVDLPGYGYAKVPYAVRQHWQELLETYLQKRENLCGLALIMDARHPLTELDYMMLEWFRPSGKPVHVLLTKSDKLTRSAAARTLQDVRSKLAALSPVYSAQLFSSLKKSGLDEAETCISSWLPLMNTVITKKNGSRHQTEKPPAKRYAKNEQLRGRANEARSRMNKKPRAKGE
jgi:GTP-binding protein